ncbi:MAG: helix-turn-helix domain-containing protein [Colwellia sp.]
MDSIIFNLHDMFIAMTVILAVLFSLMFLSSHKMSNASTYLLAGFLIAHAFISIHELTYYGEQFRYKILDISPNLFFIGSFAYFFDAVLMYFYVKSIICEDLSLRKKDAIHLIPLCLYFIYMFDVYYGLDIMSQKVTILEWRLTSSWHYVSTDALIKAIRIGYICSCLLLISRYRKRHKDTFADILSIDLSWLKLLVFGFLLIMTGEALLAFLKVINILTPLDISIFIALGVSGYYGTFFLMAALLFYSVSKFPSVVPISNKELEIYFEKQSAFKPDYIENIERLMNEEKPYLLDNITIDILADKLGLLTKDLSVTLNRHFQVNFYEYINQYRIDEAKKMLVNEGKKTIIDIVYDVGFNSKSVFYTFFKKSEGMTPSEYRKAHHQEKG